MLKNKKMFAKIFLKGATTIVAGAILAVESAWAATTISCETIAGVCIPTSTGLSSAAVSDILSNVASWLLGIFTTVAIIAFVISGAQYLLSAGEEKIIETAKRNMKYSIVGVIVGLSGFIIIQAVSTALKTGSSTF